MKQIKYALIITGMLSASLHSYGQYYQTQDLTAENLFTKNIEGPNVDKKGNLYVVNFQKDGTIGLVNKKGKVKLTT